LFSLTWPNGNSLVADNQVMDLGNDRREQKRALGVNRHRSARKKSMTILGPTLRRLLRYVAPALLLVLLVWVITVPAHAQDAPRVQELTGRLEQDRDAIWYLLSDLTQGQKLYVYAEGTSGNLDPFVALAGTGVAAGSLVNAFDADVAMAIAEGQDSVSVIPEYADQYFLAWDDDSGGGFSAALEFEIPTDGDYQVGIASAPLNPTFGEYRLVVGLDQPEVLTGNASPTEGVIAEFAMETDPSALAVQEITDTLTIEEPVTFFRLGDFDAGDTLQIFIETTSGDLVPKVVLRAFGTKPIRTANHIENDTQAILEHSFPVEENNYRIDVSGENGTMGQFRLLVGRNAPAVLTGQAASRGAPVVRPPIDVDVGVKLQQITNIDQAGEQYGAVYTFQMRWTDPQLAFSPDDCQCDFKLFSGDDFEKFVTANDLKWPDFTLFNQQGNRWIQDKIVTVQPSGAATYLERFTTDFQAPDFDFRQFPFDTQEFFIAVDSLLPWQFYSYSASETFNEVGTQLGEEEWYVTHFETEVTQKQVSTENVTARFAFRYFAKRHITFYIIRILVPLSLIIVVAWITFFLEDYGKRVEATSANLLLFIAFNFTISDDLPRLGYVTYLDALLVCTFIISVFVLVYNVYLKRQENRGREGRARRIDRFMIWLYPLGYVAAFTVVTWSFFG
jgi:hypothetical protein